MKLSSQIVNIVNTMASRTYGEYLSNLDGSIFFAGCDKKSHIFSQKSGVDLYADWTYTPINTVRGSHHKIKHVHNSI